MTLNLRQNIITWICRIIVGCIFIFSGFVKIIDPYGTLYKFQDYLALVSADFSTNITLVAVFLLCIYEFVTGISLLFGSFRRAAPILAAVLMAVMLPLTLWIAIANPVDDCGCFGDAFHLSNPATFFKNIAISLLIIPLLKYNRYALPLIRPSMQWIGLIASVAFCSFIGFIGYNIQPLIDFRPYPVGFNLANAVNDSDGDGYDDDDRNFQFIYEKDGISKAFSIDDSLPSEDDGWHFVERREITIQNSDTANSNTPADTSNDDKNHDNHDATLRIWSSDGLDDLTSEVITPDSDIILLLMPDIVNVSIASTWKINSIHALADKLDVDMAAVVSATPQQIAEWQDLSLPDYPIYTAEDTEIKMLARGNPALIFLHNGSIAWKSTLAALPDDFLAADNDSNIDNLADLAHDNNRTLFNICSLYFIIMAALAFISHISYLKHLFKIPSPKKFKA